MASKPSKTTPTSTIVRSDQALQPSNTPTVQPKLGVKSTSPIPIPKSVHTSVAQVYVTDADKLTSVSPTSRKMFFHDTAKKCYEEANQEEKEAEKPVPGPRRPTTLPVKPQNVDSQSETPQTSATVAGSTNTMTVSTNYLEKQLKPHHYYKHHDSEKEKQLPQKEKQLKIQHHFLKISTLQGES